MDKLDKIIEELKEQIEELQENEQFELTKKRQAFLKDLMEYERTNKIVLENGIELIREDRHNEAFLMVIDEQEILVSAFFEGNLGIELYNRENETYIELEFELSHSFFDNLHRFKEIVFHHYKDVLLSKEEKELQNKISDVYILLDGIKNTNIKHNDNIDKIYKLLEEIK